MYINIDRSKTTNQTVNVYFYSIIKSHDVKWYYNIIINVSNVKCIAVVLLVVYIKIQFRYNERIIFGVLPNNIPTDNINNTYVFRRKKYPIQNIYHLRTKYISTTISIVTTT